MCLDFNVQMAMVAFALTFNLDSLTCCMRDTSKDWVPLSVDCYILIGCYYFVLHTSAIPDFGRIPGPSESP